ncbi:NYN domain-containing protein [Luteimonas sp. MJ250]|uniref:NYN domain-containing protein n=1 Tax=Luteimonas sp. MJ250 TaxID=3129236 RepID=UPI0031BBAB99
MRTAVYVDGFNLYHSALESRPEMKWLDLKAFATAVLPPNHTVVAVKYFTARVKGQDGSGGPQRQDTYVRALEQHIGGFEVHWGKFTERPKWRRLVEAPTCIDPPMKHARILQRDEKGSDVSLAAHMVNDAWADLYDCAAVITNDTDQCGALKLVRKLEKKATLLSTVNLTKRMPDTLNDEERSVPKSLRECVDHVRYFTLKHLAISQLPERVPHRSNGRFYLRPHAWSV